MYLSGAEVDEAVASWLSLQGPRLMEQEVKLFNFAKLLQQLHQVIPRELKRKAKVQKKLRNIPYQTYSVLFSMINNNSMYNRVKETHSLCQATVCESVKYF